VCLILNLFLEVIRYYIQNMWQFSGFVLYIKVIQGTKFSTKSPFYNFSAKNRAKIQKKRIYFDKYVEVKVFYVINHYQALIFELSIIKIRK